MSKSVNKSAKIRALLAKKMAPVKIAKRVGVSAPYVYQVRWHMKNDKKGKKVTKKVIKHAVRANGHAGKKVVMLTPRIQRKLVKAIRLLQAAAA